MDLGCVYPNQGPNSPRISRGMLPSLKGNSAKGIACHDYLGVVLRQVKMPVFGASKMRVMGGVL